MRQVCSPRDAAIADRDASAASPFIEICIMGVMPDPDDEEANTADEHRRRAVAAEDATLWQDAVREYEQALSLGVSGPTDEAALLTALGRCYWNLSEARPAWRALRRAILTLRAGSGRDRPGARDGGNPAHLGTARSPAADGARRDCRARRCRPVSPGPTALAPALVRR